MQIKIGTKSRVWYRVNLKAQGSKRLPLCRLKVLSYNHPFLTQTFLHILQIGRGEGDIITIISLTIIKISIMVTPDSSSAIARMGVIRALEEFMRAQTSVQAVGRRHRIIPRVGDTYQSARGEGQ